MTPRSDMRPVPGLTEICADGRVQGESAAHVEGQRDQNYSWPNDLTGTHKLLLLKNPLFHVALLSMSVYLQWTYPIQVALAIAPLVISLIGLWMLPASGVTASSSAALSATSSPPSYTPSMFRVSGRLQWLWLFVLFVFSPIFAGVIGVLPWYVGIYMAICAAIAMPSWRNANKHETASSDTETSVVGTPRVTAAWFNLVIFALCYGLLVVWPYIACRPLPFPPAVSAAIAWLERSVDGQHGLARLGSLSFGGGGNSYSAATRSQMTSLVGNTVSPCCLLLSSEHLHMLLFASLLVGSLGRSWLLLRNGRLQSTIHDLLAVGITGTVYLVATWWGVLSGRLSPTLWPLQMWGLVCITGFWLAIRSLPMAFRWYEDQHQDTQPIVFSLPRLLSPCTVLCGLLVLGGSLFLWHEPGTLKPGRILIDEGHSDWEKADLPMETDFYGVKTVYNYGFLKEILEKHYPSVRTSQESISAELLAQCDVLILKTPTKPYQMEEVQAVRDFVHRGGGLWLIGDHTNIFGMNTYLNQICGTWGIHLNPDAVAPLHDYYQQTVQVDGVEPYHECGHRRQENLCSKEYLNHPILGHNIPYVTILTSCSVSAPLDCEYVSISRGTFADHARFGGNTFFGNLDHDDDERYGCILQNVALKVGRGRVAVWSDSTLFSNFAMCMSGVPQLALGYVNWLNRSNNISNGTYTAIWLSMVILIIGVIVWGSVRPIGWIYASLAAAILVACVVPVIDYINTKTYAISDYRKGFKTVGFDQQYSRTALPNKDHVHQDDNKVFESFYVLMQRLHLMPVSADSIQELSACDAVVIINPVRNFDGKDVLRLRHLVENGKTLILMLGMDSQDPELLSAAAERFNRLLNEFGVGDQFDLLPNGVVADLYGPLMDKTIFTDAEIAACIKPKPDAGGVLLRSAQDGAVVIMSRRHEKGKLILVSMGDLYSDPVIGSPGIVPDGRQATLLRSALRLVNEAVECTQDQERLRDPWERLLSQHPADVEKEQR